MANKNAVQEERWFKSYWRPGMGWLYMLICACDFILFPVAAMLMPKLLTGTEYTAWEPLTLQNGGMVHLAFMAVLSITSWTRGAYEKPFFPPVKRKPQPEPDEDEGDEPPSKPKAFR